MKKEATVNLNRIEREDMTLLRDPGYVYDLLFVFYSKFNLDILMKNTDDDSHASSDEVFDFVKNEVRPYFGEISDDLYVFFHAIETRSCFLADRYFLSKDTKNINFENFCEALSNKEKLVRKLIKFYFYKLDDDTAEKCAESKETIFSVIQNSDYCGEDKAKLYEFFIDPDHYVDLLIKELREKEKLLSSYYDRQYSKVIEMFDNMTYDSLCTQFEGTTIQGWPKGIDDKYYLSFCLLNKYLVLHKFIGTIISVLGIGYESVIERNKSGRLPDLKGFGCVIAEESRVKILEFLLKNGEASCKDLEKNFSFSGSTAYHHIIMMYRSGIVKSRVVKKTVYYSINRQYVDRILGVLLEYSNYKDINEVK